MAEKAEGVLGLHLRMYSESEGEASEGSSDLFGFCG